MGGRKAWAALRGNGDLTVWRQRRVLPSCAASLSVRGHGAVNACSRQQPAQPSTTRHCCVCRACVPGAYRALVRQVDCVTVKGSNKPVGLYTYDVDVEGLDGLKLSQQKPVRAARSARHATGLLAGCLRQLVASGQRRGHLFLA